jgi:hypothetical protein
MTALCVRPRFPNMAAEYSVQRVEIGFVGMPPVKKIGRASGVSEVEVDGLIVRCLVAGSFQPFLETLRGHEVITLISVPAVEHVSSTRVEEDL